MTRTNRMDPARVASDLAEIAEIDRLVAFAALLPIPETPEWSADMLGEEDRRRHDAFVRILARSDFGDETTPLPCLDDAAIDAEIIRFEAIEAEARFRAMGFVILEAA